MDAAASLLERKIDKVGVALLHKGIVDRETVSQAISTKEKEAGRRNRSLAEILVEDYRCDHHTVFSEVARIYAFKSLKLDEALTERRLGVVKQMIDSLSVDQRGVLYRAKTLPLQFDARQPDKLVLVSAVPIHREIPRIASFFRALKYEVYYAELKSLQPHLENTLRGDNVFLESIKEMEAELQEGDIETGIDEAELDQEINKSMLVNLFEGCLVEAVRTGVSDIHIFPTNKSTTEFHFRLDGKLQVWKKVEGTRPEAVLAVVKDRSINIDRFEREAAQDGFIQRTIDNIVIRFRVSVLPISGSEYAQKYESIVVRVLDSRKVIKDIAKIGFQPKAYEWFKAAISRPQGMVILTGPTGSGKSTTLVAALYAVITPQVNVLTVEDPVEYVIDGARQIKISHKVDFEQAIRAILRHDPDIVMVGEMRDKTTADIAIKLANTGHLTFSTLHTNDAPSAVTRLFKMGIEPFLIAYAINLVVAQRLVRRLCEKCKRPTRDLDEAQLTNVGFTKEEIANTTFYEAVGCQSCVKGYKGRAAIHEALFFSKAIRQAIFDSGDEIDEDRIRQIAIGEGMLTLRASARERVKEGVTSVAEVISATMSDE
ncbi:MAG: ATPase, T2SS/T4P/T4SS family [Bacteroidota bacterium]|jgi:type IV pilus assembly protein PilB|nr:ATPase, T2SS/T4P/T4SS family [Bacteroidota bacterium]